MIEPMGAMISGTVNQPQSIQRRSVQCLHKLAARDAEARRLKPTIQFNQFSIWDFDITKFSISLIHTFVRSVEVLDLLDGSLNFLTQLAGNMAIPTPLRSIAIAVFIYHSCDNCLHFP
jgi:hypothetical protein